MIGVVTSGLCGVVLMAFRLKTVSVFVYKLSYLLYFVFKSRSGHAVLWSFNVNR